MHAGSIRHATVAPHALGSRRMFEQYVKAHAGDPRWRRVMGVAAIVSGATTSTLVVVTVVAHLLNVGRVEPLRERVDPVRARREDAGLGEAKGVPHGIEDDLRAKLDLVPVRPPPPDDTPAKIPIAILRAHAIHSPSPPDSEIAKTMAARVHRRPGSSRVSFCVSEIGKVEDARTVNAFPNDPEIDRLCVETVKTWWFRPWTVNGKAHRACSTVEFAFTFE